MAIFSQGCKPDKFEHYNSLKISFTNIRGLCSNFVEYESFLESNYPDILTLCETNLDDSTDFHNFSVRGYLSLIGKVSITHMYGRLVHGKEGLPFARDLSLENCRLLFMFLTSFTSVSVIFLFPLLITFFVIMSSFLFNII